MYVIPGAHRAGKVSFASPMCSCSHPGQLVYGPTSISFYVLFVDGETWCCHNEKVEDGSSILLWVLGQHVQAVLTSGGGGGGSQVKLV